MNEKEAIERLKKDKNKPLACGDITIVNIDDLETVLNLLEKKDNIIDLMAEQLAGLAIFDIEKDEPLILGDKEEVKQYFKEKVEEDNLC